MSEREYERLLARVVIRFGSLVDPHASAYGWRDDTRHLRKCDVVAHGRATESQWPEFVSTFEDNHWKVGVDLPGVTCACGRVTGRTMRLDVSVPEAIRYVLEELDRGERSE